MEVSPAVTRGLCIAKQATGGAAKVSQFLVDGVCTVANYIGKELAPHVKKDGSKFVPESLMTDKDGKSTLVWCHGCGSEFKDFQLSGRVWSVRLNASSVMCLQKPYKPIKVWAQFRRSYTQRGELRYLCWPHCLQY